MAFLQLVVFSVIQGKLKQFEHNISGPHILFLEGCADTKMQYHHRCSSTTVPVPTSVLESARWDEVDEISIQHLARPDA